MHPAQLLQTLTTRAAKDGSPATAYGVTVTPKGRYQYSATKVRISENVALDMIREGQRRWEATPAPKAPKAQSTGNGPRRTGFTWSCLNQATQDFFLRLAGDIQSATIDADNTCSVRLGHEIPSIKLQDAPRLSNCKKAGLVETFEGVKKTYRMIRLTDAGREVYRSYGG